MEMEKQMFGKQIFAEPSFTMGHRGGFDQMGRAWFFPVYCAFFNIKLQLSTMLATFLEPVLDKYKFFQVIQEKVKLFFPDSFTLQK